MVFRQILVIWDLEIVFLVFAPELYYECFPIHVSVVAFLSMGQTLYLSHLDWLYPRQCSLLLAFLLDLVKTPSETQVTWDRLSQALWESWQSPWLEDRSISALHSVLEDLGWLWGCP